MCLPIYVSFLFLLPFVFPLSTYFGLLLSNLLQLCFPSTYSDFSTRPRPPIVLQTWLLDYSYFFFEEACYKLLIQLLFSVMVLLRFKLLFAYFVLNNRFMLLNILSSRFDVSFNTVKANSTAGEH